MMKHLVGYVKSDDTLRIDVKCGKAIVPPKIRDRSNDEKTNRRNNEK